MARGKKTDKKNTAPAQETAERTEDATATQETAEQAGEATTTQETAEQAGEATTTQETAEQAGEATTTQETAEQAGEATTTQETAEQAGEATTTQETAEQEEGTAPAKETPERDILAGIQNPCVYCGPTMRGVARQYTTFQGGIPDALRDFIKEHPEARQLIVSTAQFPAMRRRLDTPGTAEAKLYKQVKELLGK